MMSDNNPKDTPLETIETTVVDSIDPKDPPKRKRGRPKKTEVAAKKTGNRGQVGRPKGDAAIMNEYKARMLASPKSRQVLEKIFSAALDDDHKGQTAAWKLLADRLIPVGMFEQEVSKGQQRNAVNITISGVGGEQINIGGTTTQTSKEEDIIDGDYYED